MIKLRKYYVANEEIKSRVWYSKSERFDKRNAVTIYAKDFDRNLGRIFSELYNNETDSQSDYFDKGKVVLFEDHPLYLEALKLAV